MSQKRLDYLMLLTVHRKKTDKLNLVDGANQFRQGNRYRMFTFGTFELDGFPKLLHIELER